MYNLQYVCAKCKILQHTVIWSNNTTFLLLNLELDPFLLLTLELDLFILLNLVLYLVFFLILELDLSYS